MRKNSHKPYLFIFAALMLLMSVSQESTEATRGKVMSFLAPLWESLDSTKQAWTAFFYKDKQDGIKKADDEALQKLQLENQILKSEISRLQQMLKQENRLITQLKAAVITPENYKKLKGSIQNHKKKLLKLLQYQLQAIPARVIFRSPSSWSSSLWINVGNADNQKDEIIITKNSPVIIGNSIVGVLDYVGEHQSRVRLITDSGLTPSVRVARSIKDASQEEDMVYLAKGELQGSSHPLWRSRGHLLKGVGFNYDFADDEGPARDLRSGALNNDEKGSASPLLKIADTLVTTGMDGVFPADFKVAEITQVNLLSEGDYYYEIEARPIISNLNELSYVFVIPPLGYDNEEQPPLYGE